jgi:hypothetical protein
MANSQTPPNLYAKGETLAAVAVAAIFGCLIAPLMGAKIRRWKAYFAMCAASLLVCQIMFRSFHECGAAFCGWLLRPVFFTASFYGWLPLYLPELFPTRARATAQGLSFNFARIFSAVGALETGTLMRAFGGSYPRACATMSLVYLTGMVRVWLGPETRGSLLQE